MPRISIKHVGRHGLARDERLVREAVPPLPEFEVDRYGNQVDLRSDCWKFNDPAYHSRANWASIPAGRLRDALKCWICYSIRRHAPRESGNQYQDISFAIHLRKPVPVELEDLDLQWWRDVRQRMRELHCEYRLHRMRAAFLWMADQDFDGVDDTAALEIEQWVIPGNVKGEAVTSRDPNAGPLTEMQLSCLAQAVRASATVSLGRVATMLCMELGSNPKSLALCEERDFHTFEDPKTGRRSFQLDVVRIKKRLTHRETKRRKLTDDAGRAVEALIARNRERLGGASARQPILCRETPRSSSNNPYSGMNAFVWHLTANELSQCVREFGNLCGLRTPGAGDTSFTITPRRLRYTLGTRMALQGASAAMIAAMLDHTDLQHAMVYVEMGGRLADEVSRTVGPLIKTTVDKFLGRIIDKPEDGVPTDPSNHVWARVSGSMLGGIGTCGSRVACRLAPPMSCYICELFQPWRHADHEGLLRNMRDLRESMSRASGREAGLERIDQVVAAITAVVNTIKAGGNEVQREISHGT